MKRGGAAQAACVLCVSAACAATAPRSEAPATAPVEAARVSEVSRARVAGVSSREVVLNPRDGLSPDEAALLAVDENPRLRAVRTQRGIAGAELIAAGLLPNPRLDAALDFPVPRQEGRVLGFGAGVTWNVSPLLALAARREGAAAAAQSVDFEVGWQEWQVAQAARLHTLRSIYLTRRLDAAREIEASWQGRADSLREALLGSAVTALEAAAVERSLGEARLARIDVERELGRARVDLAEAIGLDAGADVQIDASWRAPPELAALDVLLEHLPARRLDLIGLRHAQHSRDQLLRAAQRAQFPPLEIGVRAGRDVDGVSSAGASLSFDLPFFDRNQSGVARGRAEQDQTRTEYAARLAEARAQVVRLSRDMALVRLELGIAGEVAESSARLAELARQAAVRGGMTPLAAAELEERAASARLRQLETEQLLAELWVALVTASGTD